MNLRVALAGLAVALAAWLMAPAAAHAQLDHYKCYQGKDLKNPPFQKLKCKDGTGPITSDDFRTNECVDVQKVKFICIPVNKNGEGINDPNTHLICYQIKDEHKNLSPRPKVEVSTQFQVSQFELKKAKLLCVPGSKVLLP
ncbi:MAG: hypothetical protein A3J75_02755 [Acidobacteria bacterium RBG_16_68_9]|nr:MAG: hypothetical protein A3J75_02755 [Acidobacteria bacterium RBG_16_68_9]